MVAVVTSSISLRPAVVEPPRSTPFDPEVARLQGVIEKDSELTFDAARGHDELVHHLHYRYRGDDACGFTITMSDEDRGLLQTFTGRHGIGHENIRGSSYGHIYAGVYVDIFASSHGQFTRTYVNGRVDNDVFVITMPWLVGDSKTAREAYDAFVELDRKCRAY